MKRLFSTSAVMNVLAGVILLATSQSCAAQEAERKSKSDDSPASKSTAPPSSVDPRYSSPRATARTFLIAMNLAEDDPPRIDEATACLDLSGLPAQHRGRYAFELEFILRSINMPTTVIPDDVDRSECTITESKEIKLTSPADGRRALAVRLPDSQGPAANAAGALAASTGGRTG